MQSRALVTLQKVTSITVHPNAHSLELAQIQGWQVVIRKDEVAVNETVVYCEVDSLLPLSASWIPPAVRGRAGEKDEYYRVKSVKIRGELSQGLIIPLTLFAPPLPSDLLLGSDLTDYLEVKKWEPPLDTAEGTHSYLIPFPSQLLPKTDEVRVQSAPSLLASLAGLPYYATLKVDGSSATFLISPRNGDFLACSRNYIRPRNDDDFYWQVAEKYGIEEKLRSICPDFAIQGEIYGPGIQCNRLQVPTISFALFNAYSLSDKRRLTYKEMVELSKTLSIPLVPVEEVGDQFIPTTVQEILTRSKGFYHGTRNPREGLVWRPQDGSFSFKVLNNDYLLKYGY